ncbi:hypothetical protein ASPSYDRAFT_712564 [Aspergillus sydowii CBS 593.65]|uniref:Uncharacterized protein n=1 Tax=Aspergillus sydowii CBS 593.65 TaxID=1036612 RepID=A0A1L9SYN6_9EURO|nr:uncharacterized protein ASPSYDRAFT_712564 [Aspergillus sydowii CBS 593.65]OJJ52300.1 hypothetical protein ASPSYDRAFT_712564 [Aspergillus sydowii CBS 593.65]
MTSCSENWYQVLKRHWNLERYGDPYASKRHELIKLQGWGWNLKHFSGSTPLINNDKRMYLVPLSKGTVLTPGGTVTEGSYAYITNTPTISSNSTVIFIAPFPKTA